MKKGIITLVVVIALIIGICAFTKFGKQAEPSTPAVNPNGEILKEMSEEEKMNLKIVDDMIENFMLLAKVPRPSHHEEKISNFLVEWAKEQGFNPVQDNVFNVMFDVPMSL